jgi:signal transduction histidine kinase/ligand-binding sensor domain-containing protein
MARALLLLALCPCALALNPALNVSQYAHQSWKTRDGFTKGMIWDVAQTPDGYLWLATEFGLVRFDGVKPVPWEPPRGQSLPSSNIRHLFAARDGTLWISTENGLAAWKDGKLTQYPELSGFFVSRATQDHDGTIWVAARTPPSEGRLCEIQNGKVKCSGANDFRSDVYSVHEDGKGNLWVAVPEGLWRWKPGPPEFYRGDRTIGIRDMAEDDDGALLFRCTDGIGRLIDRKIQMAYPFPATMRGLPSESMLRDREGGLWVGTGSGGIVHFHQGRTDVFSLADGLTADHVLGLFEDREGNMWASTINGLDRFREFPVSSYTVKQGLSNLPAMAVLATKDGAIWFDTADGLERLIEKRVTVYGKRGARFAAGTRAINDSGVPDHRMTLFADSRGRFWISSLNGVGYLENDRYISTAAPGGVIAAIADDVSGSLWMAHPELGLVRLSPNNEVQRFPWDRLGRQGPSSTLASSPPQGGVWMGFFKGGIAWFRDGQVRASYSATDGLGSGRVNDLRFDQGGVLWAATDGGLSLLKDGHLATLSSKNGLPCDAVHWTMEDDSQSVWMMMPCGLVRVARSELDSTSPALHPTVFGAPDGVSLRTLAGNINPHVAKTPDGRLWFWNVDGIAVVDPRHLPFNKLSPPVDIHTVKINGKEAKPEEGLKLSHSSNELEIRYTALSLTNPDRVQFRYMLEGKDKGWQDAGTQRYADYGGLAPKSYRFRVMASNNDGVWNEAGASWNFTIVPAYYQTNWFFALCVMAGAGFLWLLYLLRVRYLKHAFNVQMEARVGERTRIARDLHDTLLQSFQGVLLKFHAVSFMLPEGSKALTTLEGAIEQARAAIAEGRDAVQGLRSSTLVNNELGPAINVFGQGLVADQANGNGPAFCVQVEGRSRELVPLVRDEIYRIAIEALRNAFQHSRAKNIEVEIHYDRRQLRMRVRDDGNGIDPKILGEGGRKGHHGLPGMHERAKLAGGKLSVWSKPDSGTEVELSVPAAVAYAKSSASREPIGVAHE